MTRDDTGCSRPCPDPEIVLVTSRWPKNRNLYFTAEKLVRLLEAVAPRVTWILTEQSDKQYPDPSCDVIRIEDRYPERGLLARGAALILHQIRVSRAIWRMKGRVFLFAFGTDYFVLPLLVAKIRGRGVVLRSDGRTSVIIERYWEGRHTLFSLLYRAIERASYGLADLIVPETNGMVALYGMDRYRGKILSGALYVDTEAFQPERPLPARRFDAGFVGRLSAEKGAMSFVEGVALAGGAACRRAVIIGDGELGAPIQARIRDAGLGASIDCPGWIENTRLPEYLNEIKVLVLPSAREGLPNVVLEAMACGCVVLATGVGGIPDVVRPGQTGFLLASGSPESVASGLLEIQRTREIQNYGINARNLIINEYSYRSALQRYNKIYDLIKKIYQE